MNKPTQTWQELAEELRMEIEQWQNPIFESMMGPLPQNITDPILEEAYADEHLLENPFQVLNENITEQIEEEFKVKTNENESKS
jgi:hypothetical protein